MPHSRPTQANADAAVVDGFGDEWGRFDQAALGREERQAIFDAYFAVFPWERLPDGAIGADIGCGSGRWAGLVAGRVGTLHCVDASEAALAVARRSLATMPNVVFHHASVGALPFAPESLDFAYSLGVLHHVPDTAAGIGACAHVLKPGAPFLVYLYYALDNKPAWFRRIWQASDVVRRVVSGLPHPMRYAVSQVLAAAVYWPLARTARTAERLGRRVGSFPLAEYRDKSFYTMRTDALDRFGTRLEQRFTREEIRDMMESAGFQDVRFHEGAPYWCAVGTKA